MIIGVVLTMLVSLFYRLDMAFNQVYPVSFKAIGAVSGTAMVFGLSILITNKKNLLSTTLANVGRNTMVILALSQITIIIL